jgi:hypothetical protein
VVGGTWISPLWGFAKRQYCRHGIEMGTQGSAGNVIAALASFFIPGLGQLLQGRLLMALVQFALAALLWLVFLGWVIHIWSIIDAALFRSRSGP